MILLKYNKVHNYSFYWIYWTTNCTPVLSIIILVVNGTPFLFTQMMLLKNNKVHTCSFYWIYWNSHGTPVLSTLKMLLYYMKRHTCSVYWKDAAIKHNFFQIKKAIIEHHLAYQLCVSDQICMVTIWHIYNKGPQAERIHHCKHSIISVVIELHMAHPDNWQFCGILFTVLSATITN